MGAGESLCGKKMAKTLTMSIVLMRNHCHLAK